MSQSCSSGRQGRSSIDNICGICRQILLSSAFLLSSGVAAQSIDYQTREVEAALTRNSQERQSLYQQFNMVQELRRNEERQSFAAANSPPSSPLYDDVKREEQTRARRIKDYQADLDQLYARYRELQAQERALVQSLSALAQQRLQQQ